MGVLNGIDLTRLTNPQSIAVVGASDKPGSTGSQPVRFLSEYGYSGKVFPVNPRLKTISGLTCYPTIAELPQVPDVVIVAVNAASVGSVIGQSDALGIPFAIVLSAGFREVGPEGEKLQEDLLQIIRRGAIRVVGPNCIGIMNLNLRMHAGFGAGFSYAGVKRGPIAMVTQSGGFGMTMVRSMDEAGMGFAYIASVGNSIDLDTLDFLEYYLECDDVRIVTAYIEGISDGRRLLEIGKTALGKGKPILVWKKGNTVHGRKAAASHTASLAANYDLYKAAFRLGGFIEVDDASDAVDIARAFRSGKLPAGKRMAVITGSGGAGVALADQAELDGIEMPELSQETLAQLQSILPSFVSTGNPVDISGQAGKGGVSVSNAALRIVLADPNIDLVVMRSKQSTNTAQQCNELIDIAGGTTKPILVTFGPDREEVAPQLFDDNGISWHSTPGRGAIAAAALVRFSAMRRYSQTFEQESRPVSRQPLGLPANVKTLSEHASKACLGAYGIPIVPEVAMSLEEVRSLKEAPFDFPLAVKINSRDIPHKTEADSIRLGISSLADLKRAAEEVTRSARTFNAKAKLEGVLIQQMASGLEVIVGGLNDSCFGPTVVLGLGGVFTEVLHDVTYRFAPFGLREAREMIQEIKASTVINGYRGRPPMDIEALARILSRVSWLLHDHQDKIAEIDINPVFLTSTWALAADALIALKL